MKKIHEIGREITLVEMTNEEWAQICSLCGAYVTCEGEPTEVDFNKATYFFRRIVGGFREARHFIDKLEKQVEEASRPPDPQL